MIGKLTNRAVLDEKVSFLKVYQDIDKLRLECGDSKKMVEAMHKLSGRKGEKPKPPFDKDGYIGTFFGIDVREQPYLRSNEVRLVGKDDVTIKQWYL